MRHHIGAWIASMALACIGISAAPDAAAQEVLPFPPTPSASRAGRTVPESHHEWRVEPRRLAEGAPNILIIMLDDAGFAHPNTFGGEINTRTLSRIAGTGVTYNAFHTTAMCPPIPSRRMRPPASSRHPWPMGRQTSPPALRRSVPLWRPGCHTVARRDQRRTGLAASDVPGDQ